MTSQHPLFLKNEIIASLHNTIISLTRGLEACPGLNCWIEFQKKSLNWENEWFFFLLSRALIFDFLDFRFCQHHPVELPGVKSLREHLAEISVLFHVITFLFIGALC